MRSARRCRVRWDTTEIHSRVLLESIDIRELAPQWMSSLVRGLGEISLDTRTRLVLDSLDNLSSFDTKVRLNDLPLVMKVYGAVDGPELAAENSVGRSHARGELSGAMQTLLASELIPEPKLLQVYVGRKWQQEVYSPFRPPTDSLEMLQAEVVEEGWIDAHRDEHDCAKDRVSQLVGGRRGGR